MLTQQVADTERAFAKTMADRDAKAFATFIAEETVFFNAPSSPTFVPSGKKEGMNDAWRCM